MHGLIKPTSRIEKKKKKINDKKNFWKPSISDSQCGQIVHVETLNNLYNVQIERKKKYEDNGLQIQPYIIVVGPIIKLSNFYVEACNELYEFDSFIKAVDFCFKIFHIFNFKYPVECVLIWIFIQKAFYNIHLESDNEEDITQINSLIKKLEKLKN